MIVPEIQYIIFQLQEPARALLFMESISMRIITQLTQLPEIIYMASLVQVLQAITTIQGITESINPAHIIQSLMLTTS